MARNLIKSLINAAEKSANIARKCREDENLLALLVQEKSSDEANPRFVKDFKTLADVLIQETIRHDVGKLFPELSDNIKGEESSYFTNTLCHSVCVSVGNDIEETAEILARVLDGNKSAADSLASEVHRSVEYTEDIGEIPNLPADFDFSNVGIWIDPIDGTAEYISGETVFSTFPGITSTGLDCVTVLIGAYDKETGNPIIGVVNQPFHLKADNGSYKSKLFWGISIGNVNANNISELELKPKTANKVAVFSSSENEKVLDIAKGLQYELAFSAGAGHKALKVITGEADLYLLSKGSTFKWDTCAPQAILLSLNGGIFDVRKSLNEKSRVPILYSEEDEKCNTGGLLAVRDLHLLGDILEKLNG